VTIAGWSRSADEARIWCSRAAHPFPAEVVRTWWQADDVQPWLLIDDDVPVAYGELWLDADEDEVELPRQPPDVGFRHRARELSVIADAGSAVRPRFSHLESSEKVVASRRAVERRR
jgi:hypothetical protein